jgi:hypothetical protein
MRCSPPEFSKSAIKGFSTETEPFGTAFRTLTPNFSFLITVTVAVAGDVAPAQVRFVQFAMKTGEIGSGSCREKPRQSIALPLSPQLRA